jgi:hypothetical protein
LLVRFVNNIQENILNIQKFAEANRLRTKNNGAEVLIHGKAGEIADMGDPGQFRMRLLAVPRSRNMDTLLRSRRRKALSAGLKLKWQGDSESIFYFDPSSPEQTTLVIQLLGIKRKRQISEGQRLAAAERLAAYHSKSAIVSKNPLQEGHVSGLSLQ